MRKKYNENKCLYCDCYDPDMGCMMSGVDRIYACPDADEEYQHEKEKRRQNRYDE